ncbi:MAG TPA: hypothetical protein VJ246_02485, partial [Patescibacteria group bacterium]|nr:hypothetical protein [Patescibacteria group bacterium]
IFLASFILPNLSFVLFDITHEHFFLHILQKSFINGGRQQLFQPSISSFFTVPLQYLTSVFQEVFKAPQFIAVCLSVIFILILFRTLVVFYRKKEITLQTLFAISWIVFILQISFFPASFDAYHSSSLWIGMIYLFVEPLLKRNPLFMLAVGVVFLFLLSNNDINRKPTWSENMPLVRTVSFIAAEDSKVLREPFNVASFTDSDTRATRYRYFLDVAGVVPMDIFNYQNVKHLYIFTPHTFEETVQNPAWELDAFRSGKTTFLGKSDDVSVYRIDR